MPPMKVGGTRRAVLPVRWCKRLLIPVVRAHGYGARHLYMMKYDNCRQATVRAYFANTRLLNKTFEIIFLTASLPSNCINRLKFIFRFQVAALHAGGARVRRNGCGLQQGQRLPSPPGRPLGVRHRTAQHQVGDDHAG